MTGMATSPIIVDPKMRDSSLYYGATDLTPNLAEAQYSAGSTLDGLASLERAKVGRPVENLKTGERVAGMIHHPSHELVSPAVLFKIPDHVSFEKAGFVVLSIIALQGPRCAGGWVVVVGQEVIE